MPNTRSKSGSSKAASKSAPSKAAAPSNSGATLGKNAPPVTQLATSIPSKETKSGGKKRTYTQEDVDRRNRAFNDSPYTGQEDQEFIESRKFDGINKGSANTQNRVIEQGDTMHDRKADEEGAE